MMKKLFNATRHAFRGFVVLVSCEFSFQCEIVLLIILSPIAILYGQTPIQRASLIAVLFLVLIVEALNTSIEAVVDRIGVEHHTLSGLAKDVAASAVFLAIGNAVFVWAILLLG